MNDCLLSTPRPACMNFPNGFFQKKNFLFNCLAHNFSMAFLNTSNGFSNTSNRDPTGIQCFKPFNGKAWKNVGYQKANHALKKLETTNIFLKIYLECLGMRVNNLMTPTYIGMYGNRFFIKTSNRHAPMCHKRTRGSSGTVWS